MPGATPEYYRQYYIENRVRILARVKAYYTENKERCDETSSAWRKRVKFVQRVNIKTGAMVARARLRARDRDLPFNITAEDIKIPAVCPVLGIPMFFGEGRSTDNSPTLDRIVPALGYTKGNVAVISFRANQIKSNGDADEHIKIALWIKNQKMQPSSGSVCPTK